MEKLLYQKSDKERYFSAGGVLRCCQFYMEQNVRQYALKSSVRTVRVREVAGSNPAAPTVEKRAAFMAALFHILLRIRSFKIEFLRPPHPPPNNRVPALLQGRE